MFFLQMKLTLVLLMFTLKKSFGFHGEFDGFREAIQAMEEEFILKPMRLKPSDDLRIVRQIRIVREPELDEIDQLSCRSKIPEEVRIEYFKEVDDTDDIIYPKTLLNHRDVATILRDIRDRFNVDIVFT